MSTQTTPAPPEQSPTQASPVRKSGRLPGWVPWAIFAAAAALAYISGLLTSPNIALLVVYTVVLGTLMDGEAEDPRARIPAWEDIVFGVRRRR